MMRRFFEDDPAIPDLVQIVQSDVIDLEDLLVDHDAGDSGPIDPEMAEWAQEIEDEILSRIAGDDDSDDDEDTWSVAPHHEAVIVRTGTEEQLGDAISWFSVELDQLKCILARLDERSGTNAPEWVRIWSDAIRQVERVTQEIQNLSSYPPAHELVAGLTNFIAGITNDLKRQGREAAGGAILELIDSA
jgi:hypothetical protein